MGDADSTTQTQQQKLMTTRAQMEEVREIARLHFETAGAEVQDLAAKFFNLLDSDGDGEVSIQELRSVMVELGALPLTYNHRFFSLLDSDGNGALSFDEVKTLVYILTTGRPYCDCCAQFIPGIYFSCPDCPNFHLCLNCYRDAQPRHHIHDGRRVHFMDTCALLQTLRSPPEPTTPPSPPPPPVYQHQQVASSSTSLIVHQRTIRKRDVAYKALQVAFAVSGIDCPIM